MLWSYLSVRWVPTPNAQLRWQGTAGASDPSPEWSGLAPTHLPGLQRYSRDKKRRYAATDRRGL